MVKRGQATPSWLEDEPALLPGDEFYIDAFWELSTCRQMGMGMGQIPWNEIINYAKFVELGWDLVPMFVWTIRAMDNVYLSWVDSKREKDKPKPRRVGKTKPSIRRRR